jgi:hypothetical protein
LVAVLEFVLCEQLDFPFLLLACPVRIRTRFDVGVMYLCGVVERAGAEYGEASVPPLAPFAPPWDPSPGHPTPAAISEHGDLGQMP